MESAHVKGGRGIIASSSSSLATSTVKETSRRVPTTGVAAETRARAETCAEPFVAGIPPCGLVVIKPSLIAGAGAGVFAATVLSRDKVLGVYKGEVLTEEQLNGRYGADECAPYVLKIGPRTYVDARDPRCGSWTRFVNDARGSGKRANVAFGPRGVLETLRTIREGEELLVVYGASYWRA